MTSTCTRVKSKNGGAGKGRSRVAKRPTRPSSVGRLAMLEHCQAPRSSPRRPTSSRRTVPRCRRTSRRLRDVPSSRFTRHRPSGATLQRSFGGSASNAPREQPTWNLDGRSTKCATMMAAALHGQNENYPLHTYQNPHAPLLFAQQPLTTTSLPWPSGPSDKRLPGAEGPPEGNTCRGLSASTYSCRRA